jgi:ring-1,2-phenylacetyl-CoA epoxidase subunit PaaE
MNILKIIHIQQETDQSKTFVLSPLDNWKPVYKPGQFLTLVFTTQYGEKRRSYSIASALNEPLSITVKRVENGEFSRWMLQNLNVGDILQSSGIGGMFVLPEQIEPTTHFCFIAAGSGIVPCYSLIKTLLYESKNKITLIYSNKNEEDTIFSQPLKGLVEKHSSQFEIRNLFSSSNDIYNKRLSKWLLEQLIEQYLKESITASLFYICGPFEYMQTVEITLRMYVPNENILKENFSSLPRLIIPEPPDKEKHRVKIQLNGITHEVEVQYPKSILAAAKKQNIELPYSCEAGRCSSCVATCTSGEIWMAYNEVLVDSEVEKGRILVCQSYPIHGDAEIVYDKN